MSLARRLRQQLKNANHISELFSAVGYGVEGGPHLFILDDGSLGFGFFCQPLTGADTKLSDRLNVLLNQDWPPGTILQIGNFGSPDLEGPLARMVSERGLDPVRKNYGVTMPQEAILARREFLREGTERPLDENTGVRARDITIFVVARLPASGNAFPSAKEIESATALRKAVGRTLETGNMGPTSMTARGYLRLMRVLMNPHKDASWRSEIDAHWDERQDLREQIFDYNNVMDIDARGITFGDDKPPRRVKVMSVKRFPEHTYFGIALRYLGDPLTGARGIREPYLMTATVVFPDAESTRATLEKERQWVTHQAYGPLLKFNNKLADRKHHFDALFDALDDGDRAVKIYLGLALYTDKDHEDDAVSNAKTYFREMGFQLMEDRFVVGQLFLTMLPFCADPKNISSLMRFRTMGTRHAIQLLPIFGDWKGTGKPIVNFVSRNGQLMNFDLWDSPTNYNAVVAAESGSGKSVLLNTFLTSYLSVGARAWVIDVGRSYQKLCEVYGGEFIVFSDDANICLNPFPIVQNFDEESEVIAGLIATMAAPSQGLDDFQMAGLKRVLSEQWAKHGKELMIDHLAEAFLSEEDRRLRDIGHQLFSFTSQGENGKYFNGPNNVQFNSDLVVLELEELKSRKHLQRVVLLQLIYQIQQEMYLGERNRKKLVFIDESWEMLKGDGGSTGAEIAVFLEHGYRRFRKYGGSAIIALQNLSDVYDSPAGRAIADNSAFKFLLGQTEETVARLKTAGHLELDDWGYDVLKTVHTIPGQYSEVFFKTKVGAGVGRLVLPRFKQLLYTTKAEEVQAIKNLEKQGLTTAQAIWKLIEQEKRAAS